MNKLWRLLLPGLFLFLSCEKAISFKPVRQAPKLVVEATIEDGKYPLVYLTTSLDFFSKISVQALSQSFVHGAEISISNGILTQKLREYSTQTEGYLLTYYTIDSAGNGEVFRGELGKEYSLKITADGKEYTATTTIPQLTKQINSLYFETNVDKHDSTKIALFARFSDPPGLGNYIRYFTRVDEEPYYPGLNSVYDDQVIDGKSYNAQVDKGVDRNKSIDFNNYAFFHKGDTITIKLCNIDKGVFDFWKTMEYSYSGIGNPFSSPTKVIGNISNDALGYFGGYAVQYSSIIIPE
jgi:hypothetical protein